MINISYRAWLIWLSGVLSVIAIKGGTELIQNWSLLVQSPEQDPSQKVTCLLLTSFAAVVLAFVAGKSPARR